MDTNHLVGVPLVAANKRLAEALLRSVRPIMRILIVVDGEIALEPGAGFSISRLVDLLSSPPAWTRFALRVLFDVDLAQRGLGNPAVNHNAQRYEATYENFTFNMDDLELDRYDQVWLFGLWGEDHPGSLTQAEVAALSTWMDEGGGVFATGDHGTLGAALCKDVPRVRSMRRWTSPQNPPPQHGRERHDTTQPATEGQGSGYEVIPSDNERDNFPQPIDATTGFLRNEFDDEDRLQRVDTVHPLLCGIGDAIGVLPDHPHEGEVIDHVNIEALGATEYPSVNGTRPRPQVVAQARSGPPFWTAALIQYEGGPVDAETFAAIGAYDGQQVDVGRVVVDSSLHHWLDLNLEGLEQDDLTQIQTYHLNVAMWLAKPEHRWRAAQGAMLTAILAYPAVVELHQRTLPDLRVVGRAANTTLLRILPVCEIEELVMNPNWEEEEPEADEPAIRPVPEECLSCPPREELVAYTLGGIVDSVKELIARYEREHKPEDIDAAQIQMDVEAAVTRGAERGRKLFAEDLRASFETAQALADFVDQFDPR